MFHKGLSRTLIVEEAERLLEEEGEGGFSMRSLAERLDVKPASLYAHIESMDALLAEVGLRALEQQWAFQMKAIAGKSRDEAVQALADAYREFAKNHRNLYQFIMKMPVGGNDALKQAASMVTEPTMRVLADYALGEEQRMHWQRVLRAMMHGFIAQEEGGYFAHYPVELEKSYRLAVRCVVDGLHREEATRDAG